MELETTLTKSIRAADDKAQYDAACKRLLSEKAILAWIMKAALEEYRDCSVQEIADSYIEGSPQVGTFPVGPDEGAAPQISGMGTESVSLTEGTVTYDIRFTASAPSSGEKIRLIINVEAQNDFYPGYPLVKRGIYYCSRMISAQYGTEFTGSRYGEIKKVYSIWICMKPPKDRRSSITRYRIREEQLVGNAQEKLENYDLLTVVMLCLGNPEDGDRGGVLELLEVLFSPEVQAEKKLEVLEKDFKIRTTEGMESEVSLMCNLSKGIEERGIEKGLAQGLEKGRKQGLEKGKIYGAAEAYRDLGLPEKDILKNLCLKFSLSEEDAREYLK